MARQERLSTYGNALQRFAAWFDHYRKPDGSLDAPGLGVSAYMPVPIYAHAIGDVRLLAVTLEYLNQRIAADPGFLSPPNKPLLPYRSAWMLMGTVLQEYRALAEKLETWTLRFRHEPTGG